jgi:hypothetical protein
MSGRVFHVAGDTARRQCERDTAVKKRSANDKGQDTQQLHLYLSVGDAFVVTFARAPSSKEIPTVFPRASAAARA